MNRNYKINTSKIESGQVLLLVVLLVSVVLTLALSLVSRSIVNVRLSSEEDQSLKALAAAEAGIEKALISDLAVQNGTLVNLSTFSTTQTTLEGNSISINNGKLVPKDIGTDIWLSDYSDEQNQIYKNPWSGTLSIYWGSLSDVCNANELVNSQAALEIILFTGNQNNPVLNRYAYDPCINRRNYNKFSSPGPGKSINGKTYMYGVDILLPGSGLFARVIPLYANTFLHIQGTSSLPSQGIVIQSTGKSADVVRSVSVLKEHPLLPVEYINYGFLWPK